MINIVDAHNPDSWKEILTFKEVSKLLYFVYLGYISVDLLPASVEEIHEYAISGQLDEVLQRIEEQENELSEIQEGVVLAEKIVAEINDLDTMSGVALSEYIIKRYKSVLEEKIKLVREAQSLIDSLPSKDSKIKERISEAIPQLIREISFLLPDQEADRVSAALLKYIPGEMSEGDFIQIWENIQNS